MDTGKQPAAPLLPLAPGQEAPALVVCGSFTLMIHQELKCKSNLKLVSTEMLEN